MARKTWQDRPNRSTPLSAAALNDLEARKTEVEELTAHESDPAAHAALFPSGSKTVAFDGPQTALGTIYTPQQLTFSFKSRQRPWDFPLEKRFLTHDLIADSLSGGSQVLAFAQTLPAATAGSGSWTNTQEQGVLAVAGASGWTQDLPWLGGPLKVPYAMASQRVVSRAGTDQVRVGFYKDASNKVFLSYDGTTWNINTTVAGSNTATAASKTPSVAPTAPYTIACVLAWPDVYGLILYDDGTIFELGVRQLSTDIRSAAAIAGWTPYSGFTLAVASTQKIGALKCGYPGGWGMEATHWVTHADGTPFTRDGEYFFSYANMTNVSNAQGMFTSIGAFDPSTYRVRTVSHLFFDDGLGYRGGLTPAGVVYDPSTDKFKMALSPFGRQTAGTLPPYYAETTHDITRDRPAVHIIPATVLDGTHLPTLQTPQVRTGTYDMNVRFDAASGLWKMCATQSDASNHYSVLLLTSPDWNANSVWTIVASDSGRNGNEGSQWIRVGGQWWIASIWTNNGIVIYDDQLNFVQLMTHEWFPTSADPGSGTLAGPTNFQTPGPHPAVMPIHDESGTRYIILTHDFGTVTIDSSGGLHTSRGAAIVYEATQTPTGHEFPIRRLLRAT